MGSVPVVPSPNRTDLPTWEQAWEGSAFGPGGFYRRELPESHFRTAVTSGRAIARIVIEYLRQYLQHHPHATVEDLGAGSGQLLQDLAIWSQTQGLSHRIALRGFDLRERPADLDPQIDWVRGDLREILPTRPTMTGIAIAHELLDDLPCPLLEADADGRPHVVLSQHHEPYLGPELATHRADTCSDWARWAAQWWPIDRPFMRCEIGLPRERLWQSIVRHVDHGWALAIDYGHVKEERIAGTWDAGTCIGYRQGRAMAPRTDGIRNLTAHVAMDALQASTQSASTLQRLPLTFSMPPGMYLLAAQRSDEFNGCAL